MKTKVQKLIRALQIIEDVVGEGEAEIGVGHDVIYFGPSGINLSEAQIAEFELMGIGEDKDSDSYYLLV